ncbi:hypothetical protein DSL72_003661 [Monilinia vaccinii-corymbosi]|uniref:Uncharacterized protein n=1 Tax=Monilinia vaccinii-corymbosi TaxID=61207 RepID=A0A8A3NYH4_9HELO|nr:hypothetical protein DSL72_003661 [Monilinia vaccinii-corymbosi]
MSNILDEDSSNYDSSEDVISTDRSHIQESLDSRSLQLPSKKKKCVTRCMSFISHTVEDNYCDNHRHRACKIYISKQIPQKVQSEFGLIRAWDENASQEVFEESVMQAAEFAIQYITVVPFYREPVQNYKLSTRNKIEHFPDFCLSNVVEVLLGKIPIAKRNWASNVLLWITYARELLRVDSLSAALAIEEEKTESLETWNGNIAYNLANDLEQGLPFLLNLQGGYVRFVDDELYGYFAVSGGVDWNIPSYESDWTL